MTFLYQISLETWSHIAGVIGLVMTVVSAILIWRKNLLKAGFNQFRDLYLTEMLDFKSEIRNYINRSDESHSRTLGRIAELYEKTHNDIEQQTRNVDIMQVQREANEKIYTEWRKHTNRQLEELEKRIIHIENCVNNASSKTGRGQADQIQVADKEKIKIDFTFVVPKGAVVKIVYED